MSAPPSTLGPYPVERELGRGGMGVVYLGRDPRLNRPVAIKVLPDLLALNPESLARFEREAKLLASLNHPNIATIYGIEEVSGGAPGLQTRGMLLVLEYIPGDTLAEKLRSRGNPGSEDPGLHLDEALDICRQIALAIEAAHEGGVIHRDLKPGNVKITPDGQVKVLDFGLAKGSATVSDAELAHSPTMTFAATGMGVILGTAGYMSPEQARGKAVDRRTDIWSFGCVLFECLAGKQIFEGETVSDTIAKILERDPDWNALPPKTPVRVRELLRRCLEKDLKKRQRDIGDVRIELEDVVATRTTSTRMAAAETTHAAPRSGLSMKTVAIAALLVVGGAVAGIGLWSAIGPGARGRTTAISGPVRVSIAIPPSIRARTVNITPDGRTLIVFGNARKPDGTDEPDGRIYTRRIDDYDLKPVDGTERTLGATLSSDGAWFAVVKPVSEQSTQRQLVKLPLDGSAPPVKIANVDDTWGGVTWLEDGDFIFTVKAGTRFIRLPRNGGTPGPELPFDLGGITGSASFGNRLPNGRGVFLSVASYNARGWAVDNWVLDLKTNKAHHLVENGDGIAYSPTGHVVFSRGDTLMAAPFDLGALAVTGEITALSRGLRIDAAWAHGLFDLSRNGTLVFPPGGLVGTDRRLVAIDGTGTVTPFGVERRGYEEAPAVSRDGRNVAVVLANDQGTYETWIADQDRRVLRRAIALPNADCDGPLWSPDGQRLAYTRTALDKDDGVYVQRADGTGTPQLIIRGDAAAGLRFFATSWAPDSSGLLVTKRDGGKTQLLFVPVSAGGPPATPRVLRSTAYSDANGWFSPDGRFVAFRSDESGRNEIYVSTYGADGALGPPLMVSHGGGAGIGWAGDSRRLFYVNPDNKLMSVTIDAKPALSASTPIVVLDMKKLRLNGWDILPDGRLFAIQRSEAEDDTTTFNVVLNWHDELRARMAKVR